MTRTSNPHAPRFITTQRLKEDLGEPIIKVLVEIHGADKTSELPRIAANGLARQVQSFYTDKANKTDDGKTWNEVFMGIFEEHQVCCVSCNCFLALEQSIVLLLVKGDIKLVPDTRFASRQELAVAAA